MFEFLKSKKRKEQERLEKEALEARKKRLAQQPYKRNSINKVNNTTPPPASQHIDGDEYSAAYWLSQPSIYASEEPSFISANESSNKLSEGSGSFSGAGSSSSWDDDSSSRSSSSYSSSYSSSDSSSSSSDSSSSYSSD